MIGDRFPAFIAFVDVIEADGVNCSTKFFILSQYCVFTRLRELSCQWPSPGRVSQHTKHWNVLVHQSTEKDSTPRNHQHRGKWLEALQREYSVIDGSRQGYHELFATRLSANSNILPPKSVFAGYSFRFLDNLLTAISRWDHRSCDCSFWRRCWEVGNNRTGCPPHELTDWWPKNDYNAGLKIYQLSGVLSQKSLNHQLTDHYAYLVQSLNG